MPAPLSTDKHKKSKTKRVRINSMLDQIVSRKKRELTEEELHKQDLNFKAWTSKPSIPEDDETTNDLDIEGLQRQLRAIGVWKRERTLRRRKKKITENLRHRLSRFAGKIEKLMAKYDRYQHIHDRTFTKDFD